MGVDRDTVDLWHQRPYWVREDEIWAFTEILNALANSMESNTLVMPKCYSELGNHLLKFDPHTESAELIKLKPVCAFVTTCYNLI